MIWVVLALVLLALGVWLCFGVSQDTYDVFGEKYFDEEKWKAYQQTEDFFKNNI